MDVIKDNRPVYLSGLNGIRTIAALGVMFSHINLSLSEFNINSISLFGFKGIKQASWVLGEHGVTMFFVLSGFLITFLLLKEYEKTGSIKIREFYLRRILRIWPLYYLYIILVILITFSTINFDINLVYYLTFFANIPFITGEAYKAMDHLWSISVEEQFYLFWPILFLFLINKGFFKGSLFIIISLSLLRIILWYFIPFTIPALFFLVNRFDCMLFGALGAYLTLNNFKYINFMNSKFVQFISWSILAALVLNVFKFFNSIVEIFVVEAAILSIIIGQIHVSNRIVNLENRVVSYLGRLSFGIYVYHPLLILIISKIFKANNLVNTSNELFCSVIIFLLIPTFTIIISHFSYYYFEIHFLKLKQKFTVIKSTNVRKDIS